MNELVIDKRIFLQTKKKSNTKTMLPEIKYPLNFNMNGSSILRRINEQIMISKQTPQKQKSHQQPLSNILISKRITPINPEESPYQNKRKQNHSYVPKQESTRKIHILQSDSNTCTQEQKRKTSTSLSQRINLRAQEKAIAHHFRDDVKNLGKKNEEFSFVIGKANNNEDLVRQILADRKIWKEIKWGEGVPNLKWVFSKERHNYKKMWSFTQTRAINHFQFNEELTTKDNLIRNLQLYCQTKKMEIFTLTPVTFIVDFDDEYCEYNMKQFLSFFLKNDPRKNLATSRRNVGSTYNFVNKFQPYMAWQNSDIKKKVNILSRPVNNATYYSSQPEPGYVWLLKPTGLNRGRGIQIFDNLEDLQKLLMDFLLVMNRKNFCNKEKDKKKSGKNEIRISNRSDNKTEVKSPTLQKQKQKQKQQEQKQVEQQIQMEQSETKFCRQSFKLSSCSFVIQKYVQRPFLIQKRKFDIRVWTLLTHNLHLYFFKQGYIRTSAQQFQLNDIHNYFIHLTNNAIQKNSASYGLFENGNQLSFRGLGQIIGDEQTDKIWERMKQITYMAYSSVNKKINQNHRKFCFQIFGLDFIIDQELKVWLIQINQNPCIQCASPLLGKLIPRMMNDAFRLTIDQIFTDKKPTEKVYPVPGYSNNQNMWQLLGQLGPNAEYSPQKQQTKDVIIRDSLKQSLKQHIRDVMKQPSLRQKQSTSETVQAKSVQAKQLISKENQVSEVLIISKKQQVKQEQSGCTKDEKKNKIEKQLLTN